MCSHCRARDCYGQLAEGVQEVVSMAKPFAPDPFHPFTKINGRQPRVLLLCLTLMAANITDMSGSSIYIYSQEAVYIYRQDLEVTI